MKYLWAPLFIILGSPLHGAGFQLSERSTKGLGRAFSGESAIGDDASILGSNPAGMSLLDDWSFATGASFISPEVNARGMGVTGSLSDDRIIADAAVPYSYLTKKINEQFTFGIGVYTLFGLNSDYSREFATGAIVDHSDLLTFNITPSLSYRINQQWSIGAGFDALYADGQINSRQPGIGGNLFDLTGDDWGYGYNLGILFELNEGTRFGLHYRSGIDLNLQGQAKVGAGFGVFPAGTYDGSLDIELPGLLEFSAYHEVTAKLALHADFLWTDWSVFESLDPKVHPLIDSALAKEENWHDSIRISIGATYQYNNRLTFRGGLAYDESPVDNSYRTLRIPDGDRIWASLGLTYQLNDTFALDLGYTHIFAESVEISPEAAGGNSDAFSGRLEGRVDIVGIGVSGRF
ncbi:outer membrane protein transport protein [Verrucomicrobiaceae bacterium 227]